jgi:integrase
MASITKHTTGWRVQISVKGVRESAVLRTKSDAQAWAVEREAAMRRMERTGVNTDKTLQQAFDRYADEVSEHKKTNKKERNRLIALAKHKVEGVGIGTFRLCDVTPEVLGIWRDTRMRDGASGATVVRDMNLLSHVFTIARREWKWVVASPTTDVRRPKTAAARDRRISDAEIAQLCHALAFQDGPVKTKMQAVAVAMLFAIETAMRAGEICGLIEGDIVGRTATLRDTKNGTSRQVPLSKRARHLLELLPPGDTVFGLSAASLDAIFRKARDKTLIENLTFHDTRHEAITRLARKIDVLDLARMVGHRDIKQLLVYYNASADSIASRLD